MKPSRTFVLIAAFAFFAVAGCAAERKNISYDPNWGESKRLERPVAGALVSVIDLREETRTYPKQVIVQTDYSGNVSYDINDRAIAEVVEGALQAELDRAGVKLVKLEGIDGPMDKETKDRIRKALVDRYPDVKVAFGVKVKDFIAKSQRNLVSNKVHVTAWMQLFVLDVDKGDLLWSDYKTEWDDTVASADHNYMTEQLDDALKNLMQKGVRENFSMQELLTEISRR